METIGLFVCRTNLPNWDTTFLRLWGYTLKGQRRIFPLAQIKNFILLTLVCSWNQVQSINCPNGLNLSGSVERRRSDAMLLGQSSLLQQL